MTRLIKEPYLAQHSLWPSEGRHILAQYDDESVVVYQAYRPAIGHFAAREGYFGGEFKLTRMSWIKPNFLWMMYRSGWGTKPGQEITLAIWLKRAAFDRIISEAVLSHYVSEVHSSREAWKQQVSGSDVRLQWDPDHAPTGDKVARRAVQLGLRGEVLARYSKDWVLHIEDVSAFVAEQRQNATPARYDQLVTPRERVYPAPSIADP